MVASKGTSIEIVILGQVAKNFLFKIWAISTFTWQMMLYRKILKIMESSRMEISYQSMISKDT